MDTEEEYLLGKEIVQSGQTNAAWDALRNEKGDWPEESAKWMRFRMFSLVELIEMMDQYKGRIAGNVCSVYYSIPLYHVQVVHPVLHIGVDSEADYAIVKAIVTSGESAAQWDALRSEEGDWPEDRREWNRFRHYSLDNLKQMILSYRKVNLGEVPSYS